VRQAWNQEQAMVRRTGEGTRTWTDSEKAELLQTGRVQGYQGHHVHDVSTHPHMAGDPNNVRFMRPDEHLTQHGGNWRNSTTGELVNRQ
jgi:hypothetical protein